MELKGFFRKPCLSQLRFFFCDDGETNFQNGKFGGNVDFSESGILID